MDPIVGLARGQQYNLPKRFQQFHPSLNTLEVDGRGLNSEGRVRELMRCIRKVKPSIVLPMSLVEANDAVVRCKQAGDDLRLVVHAQGNLPEMLADLQHYQPVIDHVVCPGRLTRRFLNQCASFEEARVSHIPNGADEPTNARVKDSRRILRIGYVGRFTQADKRVLDLVGLCEELEKRQVAFQMVVIGGGPAHADLQAGLSRFSGVTISGPVSHDSLYRDVFPALDALVLCSSSEAFGIILAEAMMNRVVPVTAEYTGFHSERLVIHGQTGLSFAVGDMSHAADHFKSLADSPQLVAELAEKCQRHVMQSYTWSMSLRRWHTRLHEISERPARRVPHDFSTLKSSDRGRLDSLHLPPTLIHWVRRLRRSVMGCSVPPGGEEWPLFSNHCDEGVKCRIVEQCRELEQSAAGQSSNPL